MIKYCEAMGWNNYKIYTDAGYSGASTDRPALQKMIKDIKAGKIKKVLVYKLDRLSRSQLDTLYLIEKVFLANNCDFVSMSEQFDTSTPFGRAMVGILAVFAQLEREQIKDRMAMGRLARAKKGKFHSPTRLPIGYDYVDGDLITNEFEKMQVIEIFNLYASGVLPNTIANKLNDAGMHHKNGDRWLPQTVRHVLQNKTYLGYIKFDHQLYKSNNEAFISEELFEKVQTLMEKRAKDHKEKHQRAGKANSYLGGFMYCANCGDKYIRTSYIYKDNRVCNYKCHSRAGKSKYYIKDPNCKNKIWKMEELDNLIFNEIRKLSLDPNYIKEIKENKDEDTRPAIIKDKLADLDAQLDRLMDLYTVGNMPINILQDRIFKLNEQKEKLEDELDRIASEQKEKMSHKEALKIVESFGDILERGDLDEIRLAISSLIDKIVLDGDDVTIYWTFA